ncbi:MAG TPA: low temperature requirement protein A [Pararhizobium sp.]|uniref:low temperature requirement protein A n=1 Tax=Pararhizobium sp. TaxID=1977563 RepID=UPI002BEB0B6B|nr:low temperature requirement protein A [Pararhizobium sp.]HTO30234.1 low temperature requirement protein A [Pararhizobium sp.]
MSARVWIRTKEPDQTSASFPELFFDLVFVFALVQLSHTLAEDFSSAAAFESVLLVLAIWWVWINTTWVTNVLHTGREPVRLMLFGLMFGGVLLALALPEAFAGHGMMFALIYCAMQVGRSLFTLYAFRGVDDASFMTFVRITIWSLVSAIFWIAGAMMELEGRILCWSLALVIDYLSPVLRYAVPGLGRSPPETLDISGEHMAERCALFVIICLGETILTTGRNTAEHMNSDMTFAVFCGAFLSTGCMWWIYFHHGQERAADTAETTSRPESVAHNLFTYGHLPIIAGIILTAVGEDFSLSHAREESSLKYAIAMIGGPVLFLAGAIWVKMTVARQVPVSHLTGIGLLVALAALVPFSANYAIQLAATVILLVVAVWEYLALRLGRGATA